MPLRKNLWNEGLDTFDAVLSAGRSPAVAFALVLIFSALFWFLYVPVHELLHAAGCLAGGGSVRELQIKPIYGGRILASLFDFVVADGAYAGRLTGFDTHGSDALYLLTDLAPFLLTIVGAVPLLRLARRKKSPVLFAPALILLTAPIMSLIGDYYEMGSIMVSAVWKKLPGAPAWDHLQKLRHDDIFALVQEFPDRFTDDALMWWAAILVSFGVGVLLVGLTLGLSRWIADRLDLSRARSKPGTSHSAPLM